MNRPLREMCIDKKSWPDPASCTFGGETARGHPALMQSLLLKDFLHFSDDICGNQLKDFSHIYFWQSLFNSGSDAHTSLSFKDFLYFLIVFDNLCCLNFVFETLEKYFQDVVEMGLEPILILLLLSPTLPSSDRNIF